MTQYKKNKIDNRPKNLDFWTIKLPINALVSILHRVSGVCLFLLLPFMLIALQQSVQSQVAYERLINVFAQWPFKLFLILCSWAFFHHFYAGIRHLLQDVHWMTTLQKSRLTGRVVLVMVALSIALFAWSIF